MALSKAVFGRRESHVGFYAWKKDPFHNFGEGTE